MNQSDEKNNSEDEDSDFDDDDSVVDPNFEISNTDFDQIDNYIHQLENADSSDFLSAARNLSVANSSFQEPTESENINELPNETIGPQNRTTEETKKKNTKPKRQKRLRSPLPELEEGEADKIFNASPFLGNVMDITLQADDL